MHSTQLMLKIRFSCGTLATLHLLIIFITFLLSVSLSLTLFCLSHTFFQTAQMHKMNIGGMQLKVLVDELIKNIFEHQQNHLNKTARWESVWEKVDAIGKTKNLKLTCLDQQPVCIILTTGTYYYLLCGLCDRGVMDG